MKLRIGLSAGLAMLLAAVAWAKTPIAADIPEFVVVGQNQGPSSLITTPIAPPAMITLDASLIEASVMKELRALQGHAVESLAALTQHALSHQNDS